MQIQWTVMLCALRLEDNYYHQLFLTQDDQQQGGLGTFIQHLRNPNDIKAIICTNLVEVETQ